jgi:hypothetical protein
MTEAAALVYAAVTAGVVVFQVALVLGAPWGAYAMGGTFPGRLPATMRVAALVQAALLGAMAVIVLSRAGLIPTSWIGAFPWLIWVVVTVAALSLVLNTITPSAGERRIWAPVAAVLFACSLIVAVTTG